MFKIISGGQSGVDRAALDCSMVHGIPHGGWCPAGRLAEDGIINKCYQLTETRTSDYRDRTRLNVQDADATLILSGQPLNGGTALTADIARELEKPCIIIDPVDDSRIGEVLIWLENNSIQILNVAGPRASKQPAIYDQSYRFLEGLLNNILSGSNTFQIC